MAQTLHFANLLRWCDLVQNLAGPAAVALLPKQLVLSKPRFLEPAPLPPPVPKEKVGAHTPIRRYLLHEDVPGRAGQSLAAVKSIAIKWLQPDLKKLPIPCRLARALLQQQRQQLSLDRLRPCPRCVRAQVCGSRFGC